MKRSKRAFSFRGLLALPLLLALPATNAQAKASLSFSLGEGVYFMDDDTYRGPVSLELVPSLGWDILQFDLGLYITLESLKSADRNFVFRPGIRLTPPVIPLYLRAAVPIQATHGGDWGLMFGLGVDFPVLPSFGIIVEADTFFTQERDWGGDGVPLEFRIGARISF